MRTSAHGRADLHVHTQWSDGAQRPESIVNAVRGRLDVLAITDHDEIRGAFRAREWALARPELGVDVVVGEEISTLNGHLLGLFLEELVPPGLTALEVPHRPTAGYVRSRMEEIFYDPSLVTPQWVESIRHTLTTPHLALRVLRAARAAKHHNVEDRLGDIRVPTLIVWGKEDRITPPEVAERFHARIPGSHLVYLPNCGHAPMLEQPEAFDVAVSEWLIETGARRGTTRGRR
jgi:pimeloyl-ACP methyl ester carboxylesterase